MKTKKKRINKPVRSQQTPATVAMLYEMEGRLTHRMDAGFESLRAEFKSEINPLKSDVNTLKSDVSALKSEVGQLRSELKCEISQLRSEFKSEFGSLKSELHRVALLVEEQNARNKYVMDGYTQLYELIANRA